MSGKGPAVKKPAAPAAPPKKEGDKKSSEKPKTNKRSWLKPKKRLTYRVPMAVLYKKRHNFKSYHYKRVFGPKSRFSTELSRRDYRKKLNKTEVYTPEMKKAMTRRRLAVEAKKQKAIKKRITKHQKLRVKKGLAPSRKKMTKARLDKYKLIFKNKLRYMKEKSKRKQKIRRELLKKITKKIAERLKARELRRRQRLAEKKSGAKTEKPAKGKKDKKDKKAKKEEKTEEKAPVTPLDPKVEKKLNIKLRRRVRRLAREKYESIVGIRRPHQGRLFVYGVFVGYRRGQRIQNPNFALLRIDGVTNRHDAKFYLNKRCAYVYRPSVRKGRKAKKPRKDENGKLRKVSHIKYVLGKVRAVHGKSGVVRAVFKKNLPPQAMGHRVRIFLYPSTI